VTLDVHQETWKMAALDVDRTDDDTKFDARLIICREPSFFLWNVGFVNFTLVLVSFTVSGIPPSDLADRLSVTLTCMLTSVAFKFVLISMLPVCSYLTLLDRYILASFFLLGLNALENFVVCWLPDEPAVDHDAEVAYEAASDPNQTGSNRTAASLVPLRLDTPRGFEFRDGLLWRHAHPLAGRARSPHLRCPPRPLRREHRSSQGARKRGGRAGDVAQFRGAAQAPGAVERSQQPPREHERGGGRQGLRQWPKPREADSEAERSVGHRPRSAH
jgi:hypothetical protein